MDEMAQQVDKSSSDVLITGIGGFDSLFDKGGIPRGNSVLIAGGTGSGKSTFCRQVCFNLAAQGKHCLYVSFEETIERIEKSMLSFGWNAREYIDGGQFLIQKINPLDILRMKFGSIGGSGSATELSYKIKPLIIPREFNPELIVVDSLTAVISASLSKEKNYRVYLQQLFSFFEETGATSFLVAETEPVPTRFSETGIEEFLADGIVVLYNLLRNDARENAIEVLKMRDSQHQKKMFSMEIGNNGLIVYPDRQISMKS
jgi:KaiC/GvpD/RAD55 family RecA-like ATPase